MRNESGQVGVIEKSPWPHCRSETAPILFQSVSASGPDGIGFDAWYGNRVLPAFSLQSGLTKVRRYLCPSRSLFVTIGEFDGTLERPAPLLPHGIQSKTLSNHQSFVGLPISTLHRVDVDMRAVDAPIAYLVFFNVPVDRHHEFDRWYEEEHAPMVLVVGLIKLCNISL